MRAMRKSDGGGRSFGMEMESSNQSCFINLVQCDCDSTGLNVAIERNDDGDGDGGMGITVVSVLLSVDGDGEDDDGEIWRYSNTLSSPWVCGVWPVASCCETTCPGAHRGTVRRASSGRGDAVIVRASASSARCLVEMIMFLSVAERITGVRDALTLYSPGKDGAWRLNASSTRPEGVEG